MYEGCSKHRVSPGGWMHNSVMQEREGGSGGLFRPFKIIFEERNLRNGEEF